MRFRDVLQRVWRSGGKKVTSIVRRPVKEVAYRGGIVKFWIPEDWVEEYELEGGGTFYKGGPDTGTLRLSVLTVRPPTAIDENSAAQTLALIREDGSGPVEMLPSGNAIKVAVNNGQEGGQTITLHWWHIANVVPPSHVRIAAFSYTVAPGQDNSPETLRDLEFLAFSLRNAKFHNELGVAAASPEDELKH